MVLAEDAVGIASIVRSTRSSHRREIALDPYAAVETLTVTDLCSPSRTPSPVKSSPSTPCDAVSPAFLICRNETGVRFRLMR